MMSSGNFRDWNDSLINPNFFVDTLTRAGIFLADDNIKCLEPIRSMRSLESALKIQSSRLDEFVDLMQQYFESFDVLEQILLPIDSNTQSASLGQPSMFFGQVHTLMKILLRIASIQPTLIQFAIHKLVELNKDNEINDDKIHLQKRYLDVSLKLLNHVRWCEVIYNSSVVVETLLEAIPELQRSLKIEIISAIPAIVSDADREKTANQLLEIQDSSPDLIPSVLEAIENMGFREDSPVLESIISHALELLQTASPALLPVITNFLLRSSRQRNIDNILTALREKLGIFLEDCSTTISGASNGFEPYTETDNLLFGSSTPGISSQDIRNNNSSKNSNQTSQTLLVNILKSAFQQNSLLNTHFLGMVETTESLTTLDIWVLFVLANDNKLRSKICTIFAQKYHRGALGANHQILHKALHNKLSALESLFPTILAIAQSCLSCAKVGLISNYSRSFGQVLYEDMYFEFSTGMTRQDIVASLVAHVTSPSVPEADSALSVLSEIANREQLGTNQMLSTSSSNYFSGRQLVLRDFISFVKALLEDVTALTEDQQRILFRLIFRLTLTRGSDSSSSVSACSPPDDVMILLKKFSSSITVKLRKIAIIGQVAFLAESDAIGQPSENDPHSDLASGLISSTQQPLLSATQTLSSTPSSPSSSAAIMSSLLRSVADDEAYALRSFLFDELANIVEQGELKQIYLLKFLMRNIEDEVQLFLGPDDIQLSQSQRPSYTHPNVSTSTSASTLNSSSNLTSSTSRPSGGMSTEKMFNLNGALSDVFIKITSVILKNSSIENDYTQQALHIDIRNLSSAFSLLGKCVEKASGGSLISILVLLGAPIEMPSPKALERYNAGSSVGTTRSKAKTIICASYHHAVDWIREILNTFCSSSVWTAFEGTTAGSTQSLYSIRMQLLLRFQTLVSLEKELFLQAQHYPEYLRSVAPPDILQKYSKSKGKSKGKSASAGKKGTKEVVAEMAEDGVGDRPSNTDNNSKNALDLSLEEVETIFQSVLRPLQPHVCQLLGLGILPDTKAERNRQPNSLTAPPGLEEFRSSQVSLRLLKHTVDWANRLQLKSNKLTVAKPVLNDLKRLPFYVFISQLESVDVFHKIYLLLIRVNRALDISSPSQHIPINSYRNHVTDIAISSREESELLIDRPELVSFDEEADEVTTTDDPYDLLSALGCVIALMTTIFSSEMLSQEVIQESRRLAAELDIEEDSEGGTEIPMTGRPLEVPLLVHILNSLSGRRLSQGQGQGLSLDCRPAMSRIFELGLAICSKLTEPPMLEQAVSTVLMLDQILQTQGTLQRSLHSVSTGNSSDFTTKYGSRLSDLCDALLRIDWKDTLNTRRYGAKDVGVLVRMNLKWATNSIQRSQEMTEGILSKILLVDDEDTSGGMGSTTYPTLTFVSFVFFYTPLFETLVQAWITVTQEEVDDEELVECTADSMGSIITVLGGLIAFTKGKPELDRSPVLTAALRGGRRFVEVFLKSYKFLQRLFSVNVVGQNKFLAMLGALQKSTRQLQVLCAHGKVIRDKSVSQETPAIKKLLEHLIYRMKALVEEHKCQGAFWVGNLKHRRIDGSELRDEDEDEEFREKRNSKSKRKKPEGSAGSNKKSSSAKKRRQEVDEEESGEEGGGGSGQEAGEEAPEDDDRIDEEEQDSGSDELVDELADEDEEDHDDAADQSDADNQEDNEEESTVTRPRNIIRNSGVARGRETGRSRLSKENSSEEAESDEEEEEDEDGSRSERPVIKRAQPITNRPSSANRRTKISAGSGDVVDVMEKENEAGSNSQSNKMGGSADGKSRAVSSQLSTTSSKKKFQQPLKNKQLVSRSRVVQSDDDDEE